MAKPCSPDLRERVVKAVVQDGMSRRQAAERFGIGASTVIKMDATLARYGSHRAGSDGWSPSQEDRWELANLAAGALS
jgi:transposase